MKKSTTIYSLDLLKFIMCAMIVSIHTKGLEQPVLLNHVIHVYVNSAVPIFFLISSFLFFRGVELGGAV